MDIQISREFASSLLDACQVSEQTSISPQRLIEPKFLTAFSDFLENILATWTSLPYQLQTVFQHAFDANGWHLSNNTCDVGGDIASWIKSEINNHSTPHEDPATRLYNNLCKLSKPTTPVQRLMRQVYLVEFYHLREIFHIHFTSPNREPLATYIGRRLSLEAEEVRSVCKYLASAGKRLDAIARKLGGFGALLLPHDVARTRLEKRIPLEGPEFDDVVHSLADQGVHCNEGTQSYYDLAGQFFSSRHDEAIRLAEVLKTASTHNSSTRKRKRPKRISIETLDIEPRTAEANGPRESAEGDLRDESTKLFTPQDTMLETDTVHFTDQLDHHSNRTGTIRQNAACLQDRSVVEDPPQGTLQEPALFSQDRQDHGAVYHQEPVSHSNEQVLEKTGITDHIWESTEPDIAGFRSVMDTPPLEVVGNGF